MDNKPSANDVRMFKRQRCAVCECEEKFNFHVPDDTWRKVVPKEYRNRVVCLSCFDGFASENGIDYAAVLKKLYFPGDKAAVKFEVESGHKV